MELGIESARRGKLVCKWRRVCAGPYCHFTLPSTHTMLNTRQHTPPYSVTRVTNTLCHTPLTPLTDAWRKHVNRMDSRELAIAKTALSVPAAAPLALFHLALVRFLSARVQLRLHQAHVHAGSVFASSLTMCACSASNVSATCSCAVCAYGSHSACTLCVLSCCTAPATSACTHTLSPSVPLLAHLFRCLR